jgi:hypothetical protein
MIDPSKDDEDRELNEIKYNIEDAYAKWKISEQHHNLLNKKKSLLWIRIKIKIKQVTIRFKAVLVKKRWDVIH